jgi:DNA-binding MarR family transcriptional regulator
MANVEDLLAKSKAKLAARNKSPKKVTISGPQRPWQENLAQYQKTDEILPSSALPTESISGKLLVSGGPLEVCDSQASGNAPECCKVQDSGEVLVSNVSSAPSDLPVSCQSQELRIGKESGEMSLPCKGPESCNVQVFSKSQAVGDSQESCSIRDTRKKLSWQETLPSPPLLSESMPIGSQESCKSQEYQVLKESGKGEVYGESHLSCLQESCSRRDAGESVASCQLKEPGLAVATGKIQATGVLQESGNTHPYSESQETRVSQDTGVTSVACNNKESNNKQESCSESDTFKTGVSSLSPSYIKLQESGKSLENRVLQESVDEQVSIASQLSSDLQESSIKRDSGRSPATGELSMPDYQTPGKLQESWSPSDVSEVQVTDVLQGSYILRDAGKNPVTAGKQESCSSQVSSKSKELSLEPDTSKMQAHGSSAYGDLQEPGVKQVSGSMLGAGENPANKSSIFDGSSNRSLTDKGLTTLADLFSITTGYACVPNRLLEFAFSVRSNLSLSELRLLLYFIRQTIGCKRTTIEVSTDEIVATTGLDRSKLHKFVGALEGRGLLIRHHGRGVANRYELPFVPPDEKE